MSGNDGQKRMYDSLYKDRKYLEYDVPDYKIIGNRRFKNKKILVLGAGTARDIKYLIKDNKVYAQDISKTAIKHLNTLGIIASEGDLNKTLKYDDKVFDLIIAKDILEHLYNPMMLLKEMGRVLRPSGYVVINVPNHFYSYMRLRLLFGKGLVWKTFIHNHTKQFNEWDYMHKIFFTWGGFKKFVKKGGFRIVKQYNDFGTLNHYSDPQLVKLHLKHMLNDTKLPTSALIKVIIKLIEIFDFIVPIKIRSNITSISPGFFCASFYVWCVPAKLNK